MAISDIGDDVSNVLNQISTNQTSIDAICYPDDIMNSSEYANSYTAFYISIHTEESLDGQEVLAENQRYTDAKRGAMARASETYENRYDIAGLATTATVSLSARTIVKNIAERAGLSAGKAELLGDGTAVMTATDAEFGATGRNNLAYRQQKAFIVLPTPSLTSTYSMQWDQEPMPLAAGVVEGLAKVMSGDPAQPDMLGAFKNFISTGSDALGTIIQKTPEFGGYYSRLSGTAVNPRKEQLFKDVNFREFSFTYTFAPRSASEASTVREIIRQFKYHAHPSLRSEGGNFLYTYPSEFDIVHYFNNRINPNLPRHATSILKNVSVNYAPNGHYNVNRDGFPSQIQLSLQFEEVALLTKDDFRKTLETTY